MIIINALVYDTLLSYWLVIVVASVISQLRLRIGTLWVAVAFTVLWVHVVISEAFADVPEKDAVFFIGSTIRIGIASTIVGMFAWAGLRVWGKG